MTEFTGINRIGISGYKSIKDESLEIRPITVLAGANSTGKSSVMQPILLLKQTLDAGRPRTLLLKGKNVYLSSLEQVRPRFDYDEYPVMSITVENDNVSAKSEFSSLENGAAISDEVKLVRSCFVLNPKNNTKEPLCFCETSTNEYLQGIMCETYDQTPSGANYKAVADRCFYHIVPLPQSERQLALRGFKPSDKISSDIQGIIHLPGLRGNSGRSYESLTFVDHPYYAETFPDYTASLIEHWSKNRESNQYQSLIYYLYRLHLAKGISTRRTENSRLEVLVGWHQNRQPSLVNGEKERDMVNIADVGVGISQALPILTALITSKPKQLVYIDQPDIHLHPFAQRGLVDVIIDAAMRDVRIVLETHNALFLLALQTAIAEKTCGITSDKVAMYWFSRNDDGSTHIDKADLQDNGTYGNWPIDFASITFDLQVKFGRAIEKSWHAEESNL